MNVQPIPFEQWPVCCTEHNVSQQYGVVGWEDRRYWGRCGLIDRATSQYPCRTPLYHFDKGVEHDFMPLD